MEKAENSLCAGRSLTPREMGGKRNCEAFVSTGRGGKWVLKKWLGTGRRGGCASRIWADTAAVSSPLRQGVEKKIGEESAEEHPDCQ